MPGNRELVSRFWRGSQRNVKVFMRSTYKRFQSDDGIRALANNRDLESGCDSTQGYRERNSSDCLGFFVFTHQVQMMMNDEINIRPRELKGHIIFMTMYSDIDWTQKNNEDICSQNASRVSAYARNCPTGSWTFLGPGDEEKWNGTLS